MSRKARGLLLVMVVLVLAVGYYFRPFWWESYRYEDDRVEVRLDAGVDTEPLDLSGTLVLRLTGPGRPFCGWDPISWKRSGPARDQLLRLESVTSSLTDRNGYADAAPHGGIGRGERGMPLGGCRYNQGYILILSRPGFDTRVVVPHVERLNPSHQVLKRARPRKAKTNELDYAQRRVAAAIRLLYPSRIHHARAERDRRHDLMVAESMPAYWRHRLPDGRRLRDYAVEVVREVSQDVDCPAIAADVDLILATSAGVPESNDDILAEHRALADLLGRTGSGSPPTTEPTCEEGSF